MNRLRELREARKLKQKDIAALIKKTTQAYSLYELGHRNIDNETLILLSDFYNVSTDYLLGKENSVDIYNLPPEKQKIPKDLQQVLEEEEITLDGMLLSKEDKEMVLNAFKYMYHKAKNS